MLARGRFIPFPSHVVRFPQRFPGTHLYIRVNQCGETLLAYKAIKSDGREQGANAQNTCKISGHFEELEDFVAAFLERLAKTRLTSKRNTTKALEKSPEQRKLLHETTTSLTVVCRTFRSNLQHANRLIHCEGLYFLYRE